MSHLEKPSERGSLIAFVDLNPSTRPSAHRVKPKQTTPPGGPISRILPTCPVCGARLRRLGRHLRKAHNKPSIQPTVTRIQDKAHKTFSRATSSKQTQIPCEPVPGGHLLSRIYTSHHPSQTMRADRQYGVCPVCRATVRADRMAKHTSKVHGSRPTQPHRKKLTSSRDPVRENATLVAPRDKNLDATKLYAHPYREQGRYGSHPSHDGFDDESGPE